MADDNRKAADGKPADATGVMKPDDPKKEEKVAGVDVWAGNSAIEEAEMLDQPLSSSEAGIDTVYDPEGGVLRQSFGSNYSELPSIKTDPNETEQILDVPIDTPPPPKADYRKK